MKKLHLLSITSLALLVATTANAAPRTINDITAQEQQVCQVIGTEAMNIMDYRQTDKPVKSLMKEIDKFNVPSKTKLLKEAATIAYTAKLQKTPAEKVEISQQFGQFYYTECIKSSLSLPATK